MLLLLLLLLFINCSHKEVQIVSNQIQNTTVDNIRIIWRSRQTTAIWKVDFEPHHESINCCITKTIKCERTL